MSIILTDEQNQLWLEAHEKYVMDQASIQEELRFAYGETEWPVLRCSVARLR